MGTTRALLPDVPAGVDPVDGSARVMMPREPCLREQADLDRALDILLARDPRLVPLVEVAGRPALRRRPAGFAGLAAVVVGQQVSVAAARAIQRRLEERFGGALAPDHILDADPVDLRAVGLSAPKIRTLKAIAGAIADGVVDLARVEHMQADAAADYLTRLPGVGPWTADIYLLFCLGRADAFAPGDLALQVAAGEAFGLAERASVAQLAAIAEDWRPLRGVAAHLLWAYYGARRARSGAPT